MRAYQFPQPETVQETVVSSFGGVDFRTHPTKLPLSRSPDMQNLICDQNDYLVNARAGRPNTTTAHRFTACSPCRTTWAARCIQAKSCMRGSRTARKPSCVRT